VRHTLLLLASAIAIATAHGSPVTEGRTLLFPRHDRQEQLSANAGLAESYLSALARVDRREATRSRRTGGIVGITVGGLMSGLGLAFVFDPTARTALPADRMAEKVVGSVITGAGLGCVTLGVLAVRGLRLRPRSLAEKYHESVARMDASSAEARVRRDVAASNSLRSLAFHGRTDRILVASLSGALTIGLLAIRPIKNVGYAQSRIVKTDSPWNYVILLPPIYVGVSALARKSQSEVTYAEFLRRR